MFLSQTTLLHIHFVSEIDRWFHLLALDANNGQFSGDDSTPLGGKGDSLSERVRLLGSFYSWECDHLVNMNDFPGLSMVNDTRFKPRTV